MRSHMLSIARPMAFAIQVWPELTAEAAAAGCAAWVVQNDTRAETPNSYFMWSYSSSSKCERAQAGTSDMDCGMD